MDTSNGGMMAHTRAEIDLVCGPDSPLPEARQRYRLLSHLGTGGQAVAYRGVRVSAGVSSSPVTVKVFRPDSRRAVIDQLRSWDKGDAVLMDLNSRGVPGICLRVDGFYGAPPSPLGSIDSDDDRIPFQVLDFLPGGTLVERIAQRAGDPVGLDGVSILVTLAATLEALHHPAEPGEIPVLHMDVKPSNVIVMPDGQVRLIDFTAARYYNAAHITTIAHTPESAGPEAHTGQVSPAYDVHGFGAVAYYLVTGAHPRTDRATLSPGGAAIPPSGLRRHPMLESRPALAAHLLAPLADRPQDRPRSDELVRWVSELAPLVADLPAESRYVDWGEVAAPRRVKVSGSAPVSVPPPVKAPPRIYGSAPVPRFEPVVDPPTERYRGFERFRSAVSRLAADPTKEPASAPAPQPPPQPPPPPLRKRGRGWTIVGACIALFCWTMWLLVVTFSENRDFTELITGLVIAIVGSIAVYWLTRLAGRLIRSTLEMGPRRGTFLPHLFVTVFLVLCAGQYLSRTPAAPARIATIIGNFFAT